MAKTLEQAGVVVLLLLAIISMYKGWIIPKTLVDRILRESDARAAVTAKKIAEELSACTNDRMYNMVRSAVSAALVEVGFKPKSKKETK